MELADVTDSKSVGSNTVRVRPPPSAPKIMPRSTSGALFLVRREGEHATCGSCKDARWRSHKVAARTQRPKRPHFDTPPRHISLSQTGIALFFGAGGRTRTVRVVQGCTMAVAQSRCTMQRPQRPHFDNPALPHFHYHKQA